MANDNDILARYGVSNPNAGVSGSGATFRERISKHFTGSDFVRVINIDDQPFSWVYADPAKESVDQPDKVTRRVYYGQPRVATLNPGESRVLLGAEAFVMVEALYKHCVQKSAQKNNTTLASAMPDQGTQDSYIKQIFLGIEDPLGIANNPRPVQSPPVQTSTVDDDLGLTTDEPVQNTARGGRSPKA
jgi:hypothetical protein